MSAVPLQAAWLKPCAIAILAQGFATTVLKIAPTFFAGEGDAYSADPDPAQLLLVYRRLQLVLVPRCVDSLQQLLGRLSRRSAAPLPSWTTFLQLQHSVLSGILRQLLQAR